MKRLLLLFLIIPFISFSQYCPLSGGNTSIVYLDRFELGGIDNTSGDNNGYFDYTNLTTNLLTNSSYTIIGIPIKPFEYWTGLIVWIDYNQDGDFEDVGEKVIDINSNPDLSHSGSFTVPLAALVGPTRMRVVLWEHNNFPTSSCGTFPQGNAEVEDYTVNIVDSTLGIEDEILSTFTLYPNPVTNGELKLNIPREITDFRVTILNAFGQKVVENSINNNYQTAHTINTSNLKAGIYFVTVSTNLGKATKKLIIQ